MLSPTTGCVPVSSSKNHEKVYRSYAGPAPVSVALVLPKDTEHFIQSDRQVNVCVPEMLWSEMMDCFYLTPVLVSSRWSARGKLMFSDKIIYSILSQFLSIWPCCFFFFRFNWYLQDIPSKNSRPHPPPKCARNTLQDTPHPGSQIKPQQTQENWNHIKHLFFLTSLLEYNCFTMVC